MIKAIIKVFDIVFPMIANHRDNKKVYKDLRPKNDAGEDIEPKGILCYVENSHKLSIDSLKEQYADTLKVKDKLEDKAKTNILGVTVSITLIMGASGILSKISEKFAHPALSWISFSLFIISVAYMLIAGILAIKVLISENEISVISLKNIAEAGDSLRDDYDICIAQNRRKNTIRNNYVYTSYECIRNALICLFAILILVTVPIKASQNNDRAVSTHNSQGYSFVFSSSAVDYIKENDIHDVVEDAIMDILGKPGTDYNAQTLGIVESRQSLFIKFMITDNVITVLLIEPCIVP